MDISHEHKIALELAVGYIRDKIKEPPWIEGLLPTLCLTSKDVIKLGGVGLAILMIREFSHLSDTRETRSSESVFPEGHVVVCARLENYISLQATWNDFIHKRSFSTGKIDRFHSDYYTGEALFALMDSPRVLPDIRRVMELLLDRGYGLPEQSHWMAYAACAALKTGYCDQGKTAKYLGQLVGRILSDPSYRKRHESTPIACRTEALVQFLQICRQVSFATEYFSKALIDAATRVLLDNLKLQLEYYGQGQFRKGRESEKVQIDYIQHNGSAFLGWWQLSEA